MEIKKGVMMATTKLKFFKHDSEVISPNFATKESACFDVHSFFRNQILSLWLDDRDDKQGRPTRQGSDGRWYALIYPNERMLIPTGLTLDIPKGYSVRLHVRSSVALKKGLLLANSTGIIDSDYVDPLYFMLVNTGNTARQVLSDERYVQAELIKTLNHSLEEISEAPEQKTDREGGFGSTG